MRRSLGYKLARSAVLLADFVAYTESKGVEHVTVDVAVAWAILPVNAETNWRAQRLGAVRCFARYLHAVDPVHQVPPPGMVAGGRRRAPFLYSDADIAALMAAARQLRCALASATVETVIGLLAVTGLRVAEAIRLDSDDVDGQRAVLVVRDSKAGKSRVVPVDTSTIEAITAYTTWRDQLFANPVTASVFVSSTGTRLRTGNLQTIFGDLLQPAGLPPRTRHDGPRLGDLRHSFAVATLQRWYLAGVDVASRLPLLSAYLGHVSPVSTYWYLQASPELLAAAAQRLDPSFEVRP